MKVGIEVEISDKRFEDFERVWIPDAWRTYIWGTNRESDEIVEIALNPHEIGLYPSKANLRFLTLLKHFLRGDDGEFRNWQGEFTKWGESLHFHVPNYFFSEGEILFLGFTLPIYIRREWSFRDTIIDRAYFKLQLKPPLDSKEAWLTYNGVGTLEFRINENPLAPYFLLALIKAGYFEWLEGKGVELGQLKKMFQGAVKVSSLIDEQRLMIASFLKSSPAQHPQWRSWWLNILNEFVNSSHPEIVIWNAFHDFWEINKKEFPEYWEELLDDWHNGEVYPLFDIYY